MKLKKWFKGILNKITPTFVRYAINKIREDRLKQLEDIGDVKYFEKQFGVNYNDVVGMMEHHTPYHQTDEYKKQMDSDLEESRKGNGFPWAGNILYNPDMVQIHNEGLEYSDNELTLKQLINKEGQKDFHKMNSPSMFEMMKRMNTRMPYNRVARFDESNTERRTFGDIPDNIKHIMMNSEEPSDKRYDKNLTKLKDILTKSKDIIERQVPSTEDELRIHKQQEELKKILRGKKK